MIATDQMHEEWAFSMTLARGTDRLESARLGKYGRTKVAGCTAPAATSGWPALPEFVDPFGKRRRPPRAALGTHFSKPEGPKTKPRRSHVAGGRPWRWWSIPGKPSQEYFDSSSSFLKQP
jgi:hypothetical protein